MTISLSTMDSILQAEDMEGLIELGSPADEYSAEAMEIQAELNRLTPDQWTSAEVSALVWDVWVRAFGPFSEDAVQVRQPVLQKLVQRILTERFVSAVPVRAQMGLSERL